MEQLEHYEELERQSKLSRDDYERRVQAIGQHRTSDSIGRLCDTLQRLMDRGIISPELTMGQFMMELNAARKIGMAIDDRGKVYRNAR